MMACWGDDHLGPSGSVFSNPKLDMCEYIVNKHNKLVIMTPLKDHTQKK